MEALPESDPDCKIIGVPWNTRPDPGRQGTVSVEGLVEPRPIDPARIETLRPDVFNEGFFSVFDALVHACSEHGISIEYHLDPQLRTHVIDCINGLPNWWYAACYHGARRCEEPAHRMDAHPYKDWMKVEVYRVPPERTGELRSVFRDEVERLEANGDKVIVPEVAIRTPNVDLHFADVEVTAHGLRTDMLRAQVMTAADIMLSLADQGRVSLDVRWVEGSGDTIEQAYYFTRFNDEEARYKAGFTYEAGYRRFLTEQPRGFRNNRIHMSPDIRVIVSPEYIHWKWTDLSGRGGQSNGTPSRSTAEL